MSKRKPIKGVNFVTNSENKRVAVMIDLEVLGEELWEDIYDALVARSREHEETFSLEEVKAMLVKDDKSGNGNSNNGNSTNGKS